MLMKYLSEYQPCRMRSMSSLKTGAGRRRRSKMLMTAASYNAGLEAARACVLLGHAGKSKSVALLESRIPDAALYHRGQFVTALARWTSVGFSLAALALLWNHPRTKPLPAGAPRPVYLAYAATDALSRRRRPDRARAAKVVH